MTATPSLVSTEWLEAHRNDPDVVVLDASVYLDRITDSDGRLRSQLRGGHDAFVTDGHVPGARYADLLTAFSDSSIPLPFTRPQPAQFALAAGQLGITPDTHVVVYDALVGQWAARLWWLFHSFGHQRVSLLDGGLRHYRAQGRPLETGAASPVTPAAYATPDILRRYASLQDVLAITQGRQPGQLVCLLLPADYEGKVSVRERAGHIPGSVNLPFTDLIDKESNTLLPPTELRAAFSRVLDLDSSAPVITYCGGGIASTLGSLALAVIGHHNTYEFDGSLAEWVQDDERPLSTGE